jgi:hypothetical protein
MSPLSYGLTDKPGLGRKPRPLVRYTLLRSVAGAKPLVR